MIGIHLHKDTIMNQFQFHGLYKKNIFKAQINLMEFQEKFKENEILFFTTFDTICTFSFDTKCVHCTMETPRLGNPKHEVVWFILVGLKLKPLLSSYYK